MLARRLVSLLLLSTFAAASAWAESEHDGDSRIAFVQGPDIFTMKPDGSDVRQLTHVVANAAALWPAWSPDAKQLIFAEFPPSGPSQLWLMNADGTNQRQLFKDSLDDSFPSFSPDGSHIAFTRCKTDFSQCALARVRADGTGMAAITDFEPGIFDIAPVYSPDGETIAFGSFNRGGVLGSIYLMEADGTDIRRVTPTELGGQQPFWSPDGETIAFQSHCCNPQNAEIWTVNKEGHELMRVTGTPASDLDIPIDHYNQQPSWSPSGNEIVFSQYLPSANSSSIFIIGVNGGENRQVRTLPSLSPQQLGDSHRKRRHHRLHEIEDGGGDARWSPAQW